MEDLDYVSGSHPPACACVECMRRRSGKSVKGSRWRKLSEWCSAEKRKSKSSKEKTKLEKLFLMDRCPNCNKNFLHWNEKAELYECINPNCKQKFTEKQFAISILGNQKTRATGSPSRSPRKPKQKIIIINRRRSARPNLKTLFTVLVLLNIIISGLFGYIYLEDSGRLDEWFHSNPTEYISSSSYSDRTINKAVSGVSQNEFQTPGLQSSSSEGEETVQWADQSSNINDATNMDITKLEMEVHELINAERIAHGLSALSNGEMDMQLVLLFFRLFSPQFGPK